MQRALIRTGRTLLTAGAALVLFGCSPGPAVPTGPQFDVTIKDFKILPSHPSLEDGIVTLRVWNKGPATHEFVVLRSDLPADGLPIGTDGLSVDEDAAVPLKEIEEVEARALGMLTVTLRPGRYVLFCNLEGHYLAGMHAAIEVTDDV